MKSVLVYRSRYLPLSETFVSDHIKALSQYAPIVACEREEAASHKPQVETHRAWRTRMGRFGFVSMGRSLALERAIRRSRPALVHAHFLTDAARIVRFVRRSGLPFVVTAHGYDATLSDEAFSGTDEGRLLLARRSEVVRIANVIVCVSDFIRQALLDQGCPAEKLVTLPLGVDLQAFQQRLGGETRRGIVSVGRLVEKKGTRYLIEAYARLSPDLRSLHPLTIIGDGPMREALEAMADTLGVAVLFLGAQTRDVALSAVSNAAVFCLPSVRAANGDAEGMPIAIMEALALGVPTVVFEGQHMSAALTTAGACLAARSGDSGQLAAMLAGALEDATVGDQLSERGRVFAEQHFSLTRQVRKLTDLYDRVVAAHERGPVPAGELLHGNGS